MMKDSYVEVLGTCADTAPVVVTCEHACNLMPCPWTWHPDDLWLKSTHWAYDLGARELTQEVTSRISGIAVLATFSRLLVDPNRSLQSTTLFRSQAEGVPVAINACLTGAEVRRRVRKLYLPFHRRASEAASRPGRLLLSLHSFTPVYEGKPRSLDIGILYSGDNGLASKWRDVFHACGYATRLDEPYSSAEGYMFSPVRNATKGNRQCLLLEIRNDLLRSQADTGEAAAAIYRCLSETNLLPKDPRTCGEDGEA